MIASIKVIGITIEREFERIMDELKSGSIEIFDRRYPVHTFSATAPANFEVHIYDRPDSDPKEELVKVFEKIMRSNDKRVSITPKEFNLLKKRYCWSGSPSSNTFTLFGRDCRVDSC